MHTQIEEVDGPVVRERFEMFGLERREVDVVRDAVVEYEIARLHPQLLFAGIGVDVELDRPVDQQQLDAVGVRIGLEVEFGAQNANADVARTNDEGFGCFLFKS